MSPDIDPFKKAYEALWKQKLSDQEWLENDGQGRIEYGAQIISSMIDLISEPKLLDIGCGRGTLAQYLPEKLCLYGVDISEEAIAQANEIYYQATAVDLNTSRLPFAMESMDLIVALDVIEHVLDPLSFLKDIARVMKTGGHLLLSTPNILNSSLLKSFVRTRRFPKTSGDPFPYDGGHIHFFTYQDIYDLLQVCNLKHWPIGPHRDEFDFEFKESLVWIMAQKVGEDHA